MHRTSGTLLLVLLLSGCAGIDTVRLVQDRPGDLQALMERHEYARVGQLLEKYPHLDTTENRQRMHDGLERYAQATLDRAQSSAGEDNLVGAIELLDEALLKIPGNSRLQYYRDELDDRRTERLRENERQRIMARARFLLDEQQIYEEQLNLVPPDFTDRWNHTRNLKEVRGLHAELLDCGLEKLDRKDLEPAGECLSLASEIDHTDEVAAALERLQAERSSERKIVATKTRKIRAKKQRVLKKKQVNRTAELLTATGVALDEGDLVAARQAFNEIPDSTRGDDNVLVMEARLNAAIDSRVAELLHKGDRQYRADKVTEAIATWSNAQAIDPENSGVNERLERANKVLARLEELKSRQK